MHVVFALLTKEMLDNETQPFSACLYVWRVLVCYTLGFQMIQYIDQLKQHNSHELFWFQIVESDVKNGC